MNNDQKHKLRKEIIQELSFKQYNEIRRRVGTAVCLEDIGLEQFKKITKNKHLIKLYIRLIRGYNFYLIA